MADRTEIKAVWERVSLSFDFVDRMTGAETIDLTQSTVTAINQSDGTDVTADIISLGSVIIVDRTQLQFLWIEGANAASYCISGRVHISDIKRLESRLIGIVRNTCIKTIGTLRSFVFDRGTTQLLTDLEYQDIIDTEPNNIYAAAAQAARQIAVQFAQLIDTTAGPVRVALSQRYRNYIDLANRYDQRVREGAGFINGSGTAGSLGPALTGNTVSKISTVRSDRQIPNKDFQEGQFDYVSDFRRDEGDCY